MIFNKNNLKTKELVAAATYLKYLKFIFSTDQNFMKS